MNFDLLAHTHLLVVTGSRCYGIHTDGSDVDVKGVAVPPKDYYLGTLGSFEQADKSSQIQAFFDDMTEEEKVICRETKLEGSVYEIRKFVKLATDSNPNILDVLFSRDAEVRRMTPVGEQLRAHRDMFLSAKAKHTFSGYAAAQLKRIKLHYRWHTGGEIKAPSRADFDLPDRSLMPRDQLQAALAAVQKKIDSWSIDFGDLPASNKIEIQGRMAAYLSELEIGQQESFFAAARHIGYDENFIEWMDKERRYRAAEAEAKSYARWKRERNPTRAALEAKYGYDTKHAGHLVRLLRMGREILTTGKVNVWRGDIDAEELIAIRKGAWSYDQLIEWAEGEDAALEAIYRSGEHPLPKSPDRKAIHALCMSLVEQGLGIS
ncbi:MAG: DNA polymerase beta superfamily protein [Bradymonadia bacterium]